MYLLCGVFLVFVVLGPLVIVLAIGGLLLVLWRSHAMSAVVPVVISLLCVVAWSFGVCLSPFCIRFLLVHLVPCFPDVLSHLGFRKKSSLMSPPR